MKELTEIKYWIFDLDNTLYSGQTKVFSEVDKKMSSFISKKFNVDLIEAKKLDNILQPVHDAMFVESNPSPVKFGAKLMNLCDDEVRLPLVKVTDGAKTIIKKALVSAKLI